MKTSGITLLIAACVAANTTRARGDLIVPSATFTDHGALAGAGSGVFSTDEGGGGPTFRIGGAVYRGDVYTYANGARVAVFQFDTINLSGGTLTGTGALPVALLSYGNVTLGGSIDFSNGGPGGGAGGQPSGNGIGGGPGGGHGGFGGGGGGFGGAGGAGSAGNEGDARGGSAYGDLSQALQGGSGGGLGAFGRPGLAGGGGLQVGTLGDLTVLGDIRVNALTTNSGDFSFAGGGSGGGVILSGRTVTLGGRLDANGGASNFAGGGGGGGRILIDTGSGGFIGSLSSLSVLGGQGQQTRGGDGTITFQTQAVPEPASALMLAAGALGLLGYGRCRATASRA